ncbi:hypothetical protein RJT34_18157 [Clitoria ternatea]|uniref:Uncharacterized protein n=1 Tax=Clitoria ternatea TaxID=43366 RepID=A0AAN9PEC1_CLITE
MDAHKIEYVNVVMDGEIESLHHIEEVRLICGWGCGWGWGWGWDWVLMEQWYCAWDELDELQTEITMLRKTFLERSWARWIDLRNDVIWLNELKHRLLMREEAEKIVRCLMFNLPSYGINAHYHHKNSDGIHKYISTDVGKVREIDLLEEETICSRELTPDF